MVFRNRIRRRFIRKDIVYIETTYAVYPFRNVLSKPCGIVRNYFGLAGFVQPDAAGDLFFSVNEYGVKPRAFEYRSHENGCLYRGRRAFAEYSRTAARFDRRRDIAVFFCKPVTAKNGVKRSDYPPDGVFVVCVVAAEFSAHFPVFKLSGHLGFNSRTVGEFGANERRERIFSSAHALPILERQRRNGNRD